MHRVKVLYKQNQHFIVTEDDRFHAIVQQNQLEFGSLQIIEGTVEISDDLFEKWFAEDLKILRDKIEKRNELIIKHHLDCTCSGKAYLYHFSGSPMSGIVYHWYAYCSKCHRTLEGGPAADRNKTNKKRNDIPDETIYSVNVSDPKGLWGYFKYLPENRSGKPVFDLETFEKLIDVLKEVMYND